MNKCMIDQLHGHPVMSTICCILPSVYFLLSTFYCSLSTVWCLMVCKVQKKNVQLVSHLVSQSSSKRVVL